MTIQITHMPYIIPDLQSSFPENEGNNTRTVACSILKCQGHRECT